MISKNSTQLPLLPPQLPSPQGQETTIDNGTGAGNKPIPSNNRGLVTNPVPGKSLVYESRTVKSKHSRRKANRKRLSPLWFGLYFPQLDFSRLDISMDGRSSSNDNDSMRAPMEGILEEREKRAQQLCRLADLVQAVSSAITIHPPHSLVFEIRSSLKYFGGIDVIRRLLKKQLTSELLSQDLPPGYYQAVSPTPSASLLLAKSGLNLAIYQKENLRSALGPLSIGLLPIDKEPRKQLTNMGIRNLRDIWRLPTAGLRQRFGPGFVKTLDYTLGKAPELLPKCEPLPHFSTRHDLSYEIEDVQLLLVIVHELITELCLFLLQKELCSSEIFCRLIHEQQTDTVITLTLRRGVRSQDHFMMLFETYLNDLELVAPVLAVEINTDRFEPYTSHSGNLLQHNNLIGDNLSNNETAAHSDGDIDLLVEQLQAKLGHKNIKNIHNFLVL